MKKNDDDYDPLFDIDVRGMPDGSNTLITILAITAFLSFGLAWLFLS